MPARRSAIRSGVPIVQALFKGYADLGNDSPFAPVFPSTNTSVPQRAANITQAKSLLAAGHSAGFSAQLITEDFLEIPQFAQVVAPLGVKINLKVESTSAYYGQATFGDSDWLDAEMSLVDYGHRSVPNVFLTAPLESTDAKTGTGPWNAAHFANAQYDKLAARSSGGVVSGGRGCLGWLEGGGEQVTGGQAAVGPPLLGDGYHLLLRGEMAELVGGLDGLAQREVTGQDDVFSLQRDEQGTLDGPRADARNRV
jgi:hypothetical protein